MAWEETCSRCENTLLWWRSRTGYRVCMVCGPDPFTALEILARRGMPGLVQRVQGWWHESTPGHSKGAGSAAVTGDPPSPRGKEPYGAVAGRELKRTRER
jgi:hypothetical protein